eukprot:6212957-Pleurochrysis_carterae.AAC.3
MLQNAPIPRIGTPSNYLVVGAHRAAAIFFTPGSGGSSDLLRLFAVLIVAAEGVTAAAAV